MARYQSASMRKAAKSETFEEFCRLIASLKSINEIRCVFSDLFSLHEIAMFIRRFHIAKLLSENATYDEVRETMNVGKDTIRSVSTNLSANGSGYLIAINRLDKIISELEEEALLNEQARDPRGLEAHKRKYGNYYALEFAGRKAPQVTRNFIAGEKRTRSLKKDIKIKKKP